MTPQTIKQLHKNWIWVADWVDSSPDSAARLVTFSRRFTLDKVPAKLEVALTADTRYKLSVNSHRVTIGPSRSVPSLWYYDTVDLAPYLIQGDNELVVDVIRYFPSARAGLVFVRGNQPGFTLVGDRDLSTGDGDGWTAQIHSTVFPMGLDDDVFLHINERKEAKSIQDVAVVKRPLEVRNGEGAPWRLKPRSIPLPEQTPLPPFIVRKADTTLDSAAWDKFFTEDRPVSLKAGTRHVLELQAQSYSTAFLRFAFAAEQPTTVSLKATYSEGYEREPRLYPWLRTKDDRLDSSGLLIGPQDRVKIEIQGEGVYEPFWFRTFYVVRLEIEAGDADVELVSLDGTQVNYPLDTKAEWAGDETMFDVSLRTMRNCMLDGYSDCPFYEQLQYAGDTRFVALFHYYLSGDDRLARQAISIFASSVTPEGLLQSRVPSHVQQIILGFSLYWILMLADHHLFFGDTKFTRSFLPIVDGILNYFDAHVDSRGLVSGVEDDVWQYLDWATNWAPGPGQGDKGVPFSGRESNRHTIFSLLYSYTLQEAAKLLEQVGRPGLKDEYLQRASAVNKAVVDNCFDGTLFTDSTTDVATTNAHSWHCQVFAVLSGAATDPRALLTAAQAKPGIAVCSYAMKFYEFRAIAQAGLYDSIYPTMFEPWKKMLANNLSTWAEDDVRQRSDCHAWSAVPIYEWFAEITGLYPASPGSESLVFTPRVNLEPSVTAKACVGTNCATVQWSTDQRGTVQINLQLERPVHVESRLPDRDAVDHGVVSRLSLSWPCD